MPLAPVYHTHDHPGRGTWSIYNAIPLTSQPQNKALPRGKGRKSLSRQTRRGLLTSSSARLSPSTVIWGHPLPMFASAITHYSWTHSPVKGYEVKSRCSTRSHLSIYSWALQWQAHLLFPSEGPSGAKLIWFLRDHHAIAHNFMKYKWNMLGQLTWTAHGLHRLMW